MTAFTPAPGATRTFTCTRCGNVYTETWHGTRSHDFTVDGPEGDAVGPCVEHTHPRGPHTFTVEVAA